jgi:hypothetical protein
MIEYIEGDIYLLSDKYGESKLINLKDVLCLSPIMRLMTEDSAKRVDKIKLSNKLINLNISELMMYCK